MSSTRIVDVELLLKPSEADSLDGEQLEAMAARRAGVDHLPSKVIARNISPAVLATVRLLVGEAPEENERKEEP